MATMYDLAALREQGVPKEAFAEWVQMTTCNDLKEAHRLICNFYYKWGFNTFWAIKDQQLANKGMKFDDWQKRQYIQNMLTAKVQ